MLNTLSAFRGIAIMAVDMVVVVVVVVVVIHVNFETVAEDHVRVTFTAGPSKNTDRLFEPSIELLSKIFLLGSAGKI